MKNYFIILILLLENKKRTNHVYYIDYVWIFVHNVVHKFQDKSKGSQTYFYKRKNLNAFINLIVFQKSICDNKTNMHMTLEKKCVSKSFFIT